LQCARMNVGSRDAVGFDIVVDVEHAVTSTFPGVADPPGSFRGNSRRTG
jgi:hypothetical protein